jgi:hypothetical protein
MRPSDDGTTSTLDPGLAVPALYGECPDGAAAAAVSRLDPQSTASMQQPVDGDPRASIPSTYVWCGRDRAVHPDHQAIMAARCDRRVDLDTDHSPFLSAVGPLADALTGVLAEFTAEVSR